MLSTLVKKEFDKVKRPKSRSVNDIKKFFAYPSFISVLCLVNVVFATVSVLHLISPYFQLKPEKINLLSNLHQVIATIIFALIIFITESMRDDTAKDRARVLLRESYLWSLTSLEIISVFLLLTFDDQFVNLFMFMLVALFTLFALSRVILILLNKYKYLQKREELHKERMAEKIEYEIKQRLSDNIFLNLLKEKAIKLDFGGYWIPRYKKNDGSHVFKIYKSGTVVDINCEKLKSWSLMIEKIANENGFSFDLAEIQVSEDSASFAQENVQNKEKQTYKKLKSRYLFKKVNDEITSENNVVITIDKKMPLTETKFKKLEIDLQNIFVIDKETDYEAELSYEIRGLKDQIIESISNKKLTELDEFIDIYVSLYETFLETLVAYGGGYTAEQAQNEKSSIGGGWDGIRGLASDLRDILEQAFKSEDMNIIDRVEFFPVKILIKAVIYKDNYLFSEFSNYITLFYNYAISSKSKEVEAYLKAKSWMSLKDVCHYYLAYEFEKEEATESDLTKLKEMGIRCFHVLQSLMKATVDNNDIEMFKVYKKAAFMLFDRFEVTENRLLQHDDDEVGPANQRLLFLRDIQNELNYKINEMLFGFASWLVERCLRDKNKNLIEFIDEIGFSTPDNLSELTKAFIRIRHVDTFGEWGWSRWDMHPEQGAHFVDVYGKFEKYFIVKALNILLNNSFQNSLGNFDFDSSVSQTFSEQSDLWRLINNYEANPNELGLLVTEEGIKQIPRLKELMKGLVENQKLKESEIVKTKSTSIEKVMEFKSTFIKRFHEAAIMRSIFMFYSLFDDKTKTDSPKQESFMLKTTDAKQAFLDKWYVGYPHWGQSYAENFARSEDLAIYQKIRKHCVEHNEDEFFKTLETINDLSKSVIVGSWDTYNFFRKHEAFIRQNSTRGQKFRMPGFIGVFNYKNFNIPIIQIAAERSNSFLFLNLERIGKLIQYQPAGPDLKLENVQDIFNIAIDAYSENDEILNEILRNPPDWLKNEGNEESQRSHLMERVLIFILEKFEFVKHAKFEGYAITMK
jgi:hypothetical protein